MNIQLDRRLQHNKHTSRFQCCSKDKRKYLPATPKCRDYKKRQRHVKRVSWHSDNSIWLMFSNYLKFIYRSLTELVRRQSFIEYKSSFFSAIIFNGTHSSRKCNLDARIDSPPVNSTSNDSFSFIFFVCFVAVAVAIVISARLNDPDPFFCCALFRSSLLVYLVRRCCLTCSRVASTV